MHNVGLHVHVPVHLLVDGLYINLSEGIELLGHPLYQPNSSLHNFLQNFKVFSKSSNFRKFLVILAGRSNFRTLRNFSDDHRPAFHKPTTTSGRRRPAGQRRVCQRVAGAAFMTITF